MAMAILKILIRLLQLPLVQPTLNAIPQTPASPILPLCAFKK